MTRHSLIFSFFFFNDTATTEIYTLSLHDALPISIEDSAREFIANALKKFGRIDVLVNNARSEEHTSELQSLRHLVCRLLLEKKKKQQQYKLTLLNTKQELPPRSAKPYTKILTVPL